MSKKSLRTMSEALGDDVVVEIGSITLDEEPIISVDRREAYLIMPDVKISDNGSIKSLKVRAYSAQEKDSTLLHRLLGKTRESKLD